DVLLRRARLRGARGLGAGEDRKRLLIEDFAALLYRLYLVSSGPRERHGNTVAGDFERPAVALPFDLIRRRRAGQSQNEGRADDPAAARRPRSPPGVSPRVSPPPGAGRRQGPSFAGCPLWGPAPATTACAASCMSAGSATIVSGPAAPAAAFARAALSFAR